MKAVTIVALLLAAALAAILPASTASAEEVLWARLEGFDENPSISTHANGVFRGVIATDEQSVSYTLVYFDMESAASASHIHLGRPSMTGGVVVFLCGGGGKPACPATSGTVTGTLTAADVTGLVGQGIGAGEFSELLRAMRRGATYVNVHSGTFPSGEIRGQVH